MKEKGWKTDNGPQTPLCDQEVEVILDSAVHHRITLLQEVFSSRSEWLGYLLGEVDEEKARITVTDIVIPKQKATLASVSDIEPVDATNIVGTVHSHGHKTGKPGPSGTDTMYIGANHPLMLVVGESYNASARLRAPCGAWKAHKCSIIIRPTTEVAGFLADALVKVEKTSVVTYGGYQDWWRKEQGQLPGWDDYGGYPF